MSNPPQLGLLGYHHISTIFEAQIQQKEANSSFFTSNTQGIGPRAEGVHQQHPKVFLRPRPAEQNGGFSNRSKLPHMTEARSSGLSNRPLTEAQRLTQYGHCSPGSQNGGVAASSLSLPALSGPAPGRPTLHPALKAPHGELRTAGFLSFAIPPANLLSDCVLEILQH